MFIIVRAASFLEGMEGMETIQFHHKKTNKHSKTGILVKLTLDMTKNSLRNRN